MVQTWPVYAQSHIRTLIMKHPMISMMPMKYHKKPTINLEDVRMQYTDEK